MSHSTQSCIEGQDEWLTSPTGHGREFARARTSGRLRLSSVSSVKFSPLGRPPCATSQSGIISFVPDTFDYGLSKLTCLFRSAVFCSLGLFPEKMRLWGSPSPPLALFEPPPYLLLHTCSGHTTPPACAGAGDRRAKPDMPPFGRGEAHSAIVGGRGLERGRGGATQPAGPCAYALRHLRLAAPWPPRSPPLSGSDN